MSILLIKVIDEKMLNYESQVNQNFNIYIYNKGTWNNHADAHKFYSPVNSNVFMLSKFIYD